MTQRNENRVPLTERGKIDAELYVPFFASERRKSFAGRVFTPYFSVPEGKDINTTKRRIGSVR